MNLKASGAESELAAREAGKLALRHFLCRELLESGLKGPQDFVTDAGRVAAFADRQVRHAAYPDDGILGEEHGRKPRTSGFPRAINQILETRIP